VCRHPPSDLADGHFRYGLGVPTDHLRLLPDRTPSLGLRPAGWSYAGQPQPLEYRPWVGRYQAHRRSVSRSRPHTITPGSTTPASTRCGPGVYNLCIDALDEADGPDTLPRCAEPDERQRLHPQQRSTSIAHEQIGQATRRMYTSPIRQLPRLTFRVGANQPRALKQH
jgi:hypothetical protein